jgi:glyoxylase-like metal-dependent hydrolase (beta-lactamase superfamily II)
MKLEKISVGEFQTNCYRIHPADDSSVVLVDPGAEVGKILDLVGDHKVSAILLTHGHHDHVGALQSVRSATRAPVGIHPADAERFHLIPDFELEGETTLQYPDLRIQVIHIPGHTPGSVAFLISNPPNPDQALVGDAIFPGGPGHTESPQDLEQLLESLLRTVFTWDDATRLHPGHGSSTTVGQERAPFAKFFESDRPRDLCGDVTWD